MRFFKSKLGIFLFYVVSTLACGVKGPPLPPLPTIPQQTEILLRDRAGPVPTEDKVTSTPSVPGSAPKPGPSPTRRR
jgi:hypothetical protein